MGGHILEDGERLNTKTRRTSAKQRQFKKAIRQLFPDSENSHSICWLDVGAGYGEFVQALQSVLPTGSVVEGLEPMIHKVERAKELGLPIKQAFLSDVTNQYHVISIIDVFSHLSDFPGFLANVKSLLYPSGEIIVKTGNAADIGARSNFPGPLNLPDHLMFGGVTQVTRFLENAGFTVIAAQSDRIDGVWYSLKNLIKYLTGRPVPLSMPYTSPTKTIWLRARLKN